MSVFCTHHYADYFDHWQLIFLFNTAESWQRGQKVLPSNRSRRVNVGHVNAVREEEEEDVKNGEIFHVRQNLFQFKKKFHFT